eukprot:gnl/MRDRNA2_/MRDRNA2_61635_c0_seq2.p1 gnl/MRDRNA2_/MRDRNA2_61635_c0~~gnl/MRDRNA2_/MRDRNA2_61635_c0_seq2.p1  ORF type:complete len:302 (+),score=88.16 gnl/MRDRNA2_/MRDRNA2_61635_c0_seq2:94-999(+)
MTFDPVPSKDPWAIEDAENLSKQKVWQDPGANNGGPDAAEVARQEFERKEQERKMREQKAAEAQERAAQRKKEEQERNKELRDRADAERRADLARQEQEEAMTAYMGQWILVKARHKDSAAPGDDIADISKDGVCTWKGPYEGWGALPIQVKPGGRVSVVVEGVEHTGCLEGEGGQDKFLQKLRWDDGEIWARKGPAVEEYNGHWSRANDDGTFHAMGKILDAKLTWAGHWGQNKPVTLDPQPGGALFARKGLKDDAGRELHWVILEEDPNKLGSKRLRWSDDDIWYRDDPVVSSEPSGAP